MTSRLSASDNGQGTSIALGHRKSMFAFRSIVLGFMVAAIGIPMADAQDFTYHDDFNDGDVTVATGGGHWMLRPQQAGSTMDASSGDLVVNTDGRFTEACLVSFDGVDVPNLTELSFRARMTVHSGDFAAVGTTVRDHAALIPGSDRLRVGTGSAFVTTPLPYPYFDEEVLIQMDTFDGIITGSVWKDGDPNSLVQLSRGYRPVLSRPNFGIGHDGGSAHVTFHEAWVSTTPLAIPEPSTLALAALGVAIFAGWRRRPAR